MPAVVEIKHFVGLILKVNDCTKAVISVPEICSGMLLSVIIMLISAAVSCSGSN